MKIFLVLIFFSFNTLTFAQTPVAKLLEQIETAGINSDYKLGINLCSQLIAMQPIDSIYIEALYYQAEYTTAISDFETAEKTYNSLLEKVKSSKGEASIDYIEVLNDYAFMFQSANQHDKAGTYYEKALLLSEQHQFHKKSVQIALKYGEYYEILGAMEHAIRFYKKSLKHIPESGEQNSLLHISALHSLARVSEIQHRYDEAESLYKEAFSMAADTLAEDDEDRLYLTNDFAMLYFFKRDYKTATPFFEKIQQLILDKRIPIEDNTVFLSNLADCYAHLGRYEEAEKLYLNIKKIELSLFGESYFSYPVTISRLGDLYYFQGRMEEAKKMHLQAIDLAKKHFPPQDLYLFYNMEQAYLFFQNTQDWESVRKIALECFERNCMDEIPPSGVLKNIQELAAKQTFATLPYALKSLNAASLGYWEGYQSTNNISFLKDAYQIQLSIKILMNRLKNSFATELDKLELLATTLQISELGIKISQKLFEETGEPQYQESSFVFMENNKYVLLQDALQVKEAQVFGNVPTKRIEQEKEFDQALLMAKTQKIQATDQKSKALAIEKYNKVLQEISQFKNTLETDYPAYFKFKYATENPSIAAIQANLKPNTAIIEYFIGHNQVHLYVFDHKKAHYLCLNISTDKIKTQVEGLRKELTDYGYISANQNAAIQSYQELAYWFYQNLLAPALNKIPEATELIIVPDGVLGHLPFEAFLMSEPKGNIELKNLDFLVLKYKISYAYSANLLLNNSKQETKNTNGILAMGATYGLDKKSNIKFPENRTKKMEALRNTLKPLSAVLAEVKTLESIFQGAYYYGNDANEKTFKENASDYTVLHLAMHGLLNESDPILSSLAFTENMDTQEDNFLQAFEISQLKLNAQLVVLSACETGYGKFQQGEGVMSLARSFMYAGVPSMVVSMWQVNDGSTSIIMQNFYQNLSQGLDKAAALQKAKLDYINAASGIAAHPAFWAPFIQLGNSDPIELRLKQTTQPWLIGAGVLCLILLIAGMVIFRKKQEIN